MKIIMRTTGDRDVSEYNEKIPGLILSIIEERNGYKNFQNGMLLAGDEPALHLEDDIILCKNFMKRIMTVINAREKDVIQFFTGTRSDDLSKGTRYVNGSDFLWTQCFYLPAGMSAKILKFSDVYYDKDDPEMGFDSMVAEYMKSYKIKYLRVCPSLVQHKIGKSLINPRRNPNRISKHFIEDVEA